MGNSHSQPTRHSANCELNNHSNETILCGILKAQAFRKLEGEKLDEKLANVRGSNKFGKIEKELYCLLGNGRNEVLTIPEIVNELLPRNYPELNEFRGERIQLAFWKKNNPVIFVPEWYLTKAPKYVDPTRGPDLEKYSEEAANLCPERRQYFDDMKKFHIGGQRQHRGELPERRLYDKLQDYFKNRDEAVVVFHGIDILKLNLDRTLKVKEKDFVIINATRRCIMIIEVKRTLGAGDSIEKSEAQLLDAKKDLEVWFGTEGLHHWLYIPMIYTEKVDPVLGCDECNKFVIEGMYLLWQYRLWSFKSRYTKLARFLPKTQHTQRKLLNFEKWFNGELS